MSYLSYEDFVHAINVLQRAWAHSTNNAETQWQNAWIVQKHGITFLRITRTAQPNDHRSATTTSESDDDVDATFDEQDDEVIPYDSTNPSPYAQGAPVEISYDIMHSSSYQVPVLYLSARNLTRDRPSQTLPLDQVMDLLVPDAMRPQVNGVGVMGALSLTDHPVSNSPVFFVHPCRTAEAMDGVLRGAGGDGPVGYLLVWMGVVGAAVGLNVPVELARAL